MLRGGTMPAVFSSGASSAFGTEVPVEGSVVSNSVITGSVDSVPPGRPLATVVVAKTCSGASPSDVSPLEEGEDGLHVVAARSGLQHGGAVDRARARLDLVARDQSRLDIAEDAGELQQLLRRESIVGHDVVLRRPPAVHTATAGFNEALGQHRRQHPSQEVLLAGDATEVGRTVLLPLAVRFSYW